MILECDYVAVSSSECPSTCGGSGCDLPECSYDMHNNELCEADKTLPDSNFIFDINNCGEYDVFTCLKGK